MIKISALLLMLFLYGCTTNQLHFAEYTPDIELRKIEATKTHVDITQVSGAETCERCSESSKIVWHPANNKGGLYEGFANIPIENWSEFTKSSLGSETGSSTKAKIELKRIFLKTWQNPQYYACHTEILVHINGQIYQGKAIIKIAGSGQDLPYRNIATLNPAALKAIDLSIKSAYFNATSKITTH
ncbi:MULTISPECIES: hypothetical protein [unclassified Pseudomonas]|jgi:hypothetical protein|uniref:hypothetical protein n=1 Tax=unclassified Pseudomonas TaxID=196821 RepID=UPI000DAB8C86|nr:MULTISPECIES: hypothetical protein [unclassified Pseudomonas]PZW47382.1 hypothetical protein F469_01250 [Pseudomonas sp. URMO17WK12:I2]